MVENDITRRPEAGNLDAAHTAVKAIVASIPGIGGAAAELFAVIVQAPLTRRRDEWVESIAKGLVELQEKVEAFSIDSLAANEMFLTTMMYATQSAIRNHQQEKLQALRNAVLNLALPAAPDEDRQLMFLSFIDGFTPSHLRILKFFLDPKQYGLENSIQFPPYLTTSLVRVMEDALPEFRGRREFYDQLWKDLVTRGLVNTESLQGMLSMDGAMASRTTPLGKDFLRFITSPLPTGRER